MSRILLIAEKFHPDLGGVAVSAKRTYESLTRLGVKVDVVVWSRYLQPGEIAQDRNVYRLGLFRNWDLTMIHTLNLLESLHERFKYDVIWGHYLFPAGFLTVWFAQLQGLKSVVSARGIDLDRGVFPPGDFARLRWTLENASLLTAVSADLGKKIGLVCGREDVTILKNAVDTDIFAPSLTSQKRQELKAELGIETNELVLCFSGELRAKKGQDFLLSALSQVRKQRPACLLIIGEIRPAQESILATYKMQHPEDYERVIITQHISDSQQVAKYLQLCDLFLLPSIWEGLPNALLEAMACGCCCLASDAGGIPEIIDRGVDGFMLSKSKLQYLGTAILEFLELDRKTVDKVKIASRDRILTEFSLKAEQVRLERLLVDVIS
ncbi:MAG: glycosyltransferase family 4 protein [Pleurocapsa sp.]